MKRWLCALMTLILLLSCAAAELSPNNMVLFEECLDKSYAALGITDGESADELIAKLDVRLDGRIRGSTVFRDVLYIATSYSGIQAVTPDGTSVLYPLEDDTLYLTELFVYEDQLWSIGCWIKSESDFELPLQLSYGTLSFEDGKACFHARTNVDTSIYQDAWLMKNMFSAQNFAFVYENKLYALDSIPGEDQNFQGFSRFNVLTGRGELAFEQKAFMDYTLFEPGYMLSLHSSLLAYLGSIRFSESKADAVHEMLPKFALVRTELDSGSHMPFELFDDSRDLWDNCIQGMPYGLAYDGEKQHFYYCWKGQLHRRKGVDPETDTVIANVPANWLTLYLDGGKNAHLVGDYYMYIANPFGINIIELPQK